jgi:uncharacterized lipoprotein YddW (UPF0748 family)
MEKDAIREMVREHRVQGIHLDYVRYPNSHTCYCRGCRERFAAFLGRPVAPWPAAVRRGELRRKYDEWRCGRITRLVRDVAALVRARDPEIQVSAAVYGKYPSCVNSVAQDWPAWIRDGLVDFVCPMNYTADPAAFRDLVRMQLSLPGKTGRIYPGIGATSATSRLDPVQVIEQIVVLRQEGAGGFALFDLNGVVAGEILPVLRLGITAKR